MLLVNGNNIWEMKDFRVAQQPYLAPLEANRNFITDSVGPELGI